MSDNPTPEEVAAWEAAVAEIMARDGISHELASLRLGNFLLNLRVKDLEQQVRDKDASIWVLEQQVATGAEALRKATVQLADISAKLNSANFEANRLTTINVRLQNTITALEQEIRDLKNPKPPTPPDPIIPVPPVPSTDHFYIKSGRIGRGGRQWVPIGLNGVTKPATAPEGDWWNDRGMGIMNGRSKLFTDMGFNFVRFNDMRDYGAYNYESFRDGLFQATDEYLARGVTVMPTYHRRGPGTNPTPDQLQNDADFRRYWTDFIARYKGNPNIIINPLNEPTGSMWDTWEATAQHQHDFIRGLGWEGLIVLDLPQWAQGISYAVNRAPGWVRARTRNTVLGFHNYDMGDATAAVRACQAQGVAILIGECGATLEQVDTPSYSWCVNAADALGVGFTYWWGAGNRNDSYVMRNQRGSTFYDTNLPLSPSGQKATALAANRPQQPVL